MTFGMGLNKNRYGTYGSAEEGAGSILKKRSTRVRQRQAEAGLVEAHPRHERFCRGEAKRRVKAVQIEFDRVLEQAQELLAERPLRDTLSDAEIKLIADWHYAEMLHIDDEETREGTGRDEAMRAIAKQLDEAGIEYEAPIPPSDHKPDYGLSNSEFFASVLPIWSLMMPIMQAALARGESRHLSKVDEHLDYLLNGQFGINLDPPFRCL